MQLDILTPEQKVFSGEVNSVQLPGVDGKFQILDNHAPMIAAVKDGVLKYEVGTEKKEYTIKSGIVEVLKNKVSVLTEGILA